MKFEYRVFDVEPYVEARKQPVFTLKDTTPDATYYTLESPDTGKFAFTKPKSEAVRMPVFGMVTGNHPETGVSMEHGSLLVSLGVETAMRFFDKVSHFGDVHRVVIVIGNTCHELPNQTYRAYLGITMEVIS